MAVMTAEQARSTDFTQVLASFDKTLAGIEALRVRQEQTDEQLHKTEMAVEKMASKVDKLGENVGGLNRSVGDLIETLFAQKLWEKFPQYDLKMAYRRIELYNEEKKSMKTDVDILLVDGEYAMAVEVKREPDEKDVDHHINRMKLLRKYPPMQLKVDKLLGAIAGGFVPPDVKDYAYKCGFFVLELSGEQINLMQPPDNFAPKEW